MTVISQTRSRGWLPFGARLALGFSLLLFGACAFGAETVILHLKNGDRIAGTIISEDTNRVVITTTWIKELAVPAAEIVSRETAPPEAKAPTAAAPAVAPTNPPAAAPPALPPAKPANRPATVAAPPPAPRPKHWKAELKVGADFLLGAKEQEIYYGRLKFTYERPYGSDPKQFFRNITDYSVDYGRTEGVLSANRMDGSDKTDFDIGKRKFFVYNLAGAGYDEIRKLDLHYEAGPGLGYHVFALTNFVLNAEAGINYQAQYRSDHTTSENFYYRFAEDLTWKLNKRLTLTEKLEFFPQVEHVARYRGRFESTLSYGFWQNLSLNVTVLDLYDTQPALNVPNNDLQIRSSLGITF
jgi:hypothetical protein